jgi:KDO2-lipid IV(A) lauroyltransferase
VNATPPAARPAWWVSALATLPLSALYAITGLLAWLATYVVRYREAVVRENFARAFPEWDEPKLREAARRYYRSFGQVLAEIAKSPRLEAGELRRRVELGNVALLRERLDAGQSVLVLAAHQCNWEWMLLALSLELGFPLDAAYKPLVDPWAEREMSLIRTRFGARLVPAQQLLADILQRRSVVRAVALVADQEPVTSERKHWTRFLNRDTAFFLGPEELARVTRFPVYFVAMRRAARGHYALEFELLADRGESLAPGELTERYARRVERQIRAFPYDWPWSHKRWKLKKPLYEKS